MSQFLASMKDWEKDAKSRDKALAEKSRARKAAGDAPAYGVQEAAVEPVETGEAPAVRGRQVVATSHAPGGPGPVREGKAPDVIEREDGNAHFKRGEFSLAIKCYTRAIARNPTSVLSYSNRAMCYLRMREFIKAAEDTTQALELDGSHVKSLLRRGSAYNSLGRHRSAMADFELAHGLEPANKQVAAELRKTRELRRVAVRRAPRVRIPVTVGQVAATGPVSNMSELD